MSLYKRMRILERKYECTLPTYVSHAIPVLHITTIPHITTVRFNT